MCDEVLVHTGSAAPDGSVFVCTLALALARLATPLSRTLAGVGTAVDMLGQMLDAFRDPRTHTSDGSASPHTRARAAAWRGEV